MTELYHKNFLSLYDLISKFTKGPAELLGLEGVSLAPGTPADITVLDPEKYFVIDKNNFYSKSRNTPFHGYKARGKSVALFVDGNCIYSELNRLEGII
jgi:dihydroorotase